MGRASSTNTYLNFNNDGYDSYSNLTLTFWKNVTHAGVLTRPNLWMDLYNEFYGGECISRRISNSSDGASLGSKRKGKVE